MMKDLEFVARVQIIKKYNGKYEQYQITIPNKLAKQLMMTKGQNIKMEVKEWK